MNEREFDAQPSLANTNGAGSAQIGATASLQAMADFLAEEYWLSQGADAWKFNLGNSGSNAKSGTLHYNVTSTGGAILGGDYEDNDGITAARADLVRAAFDIYEEVLGIDFVETTSTNTSYVDFFFGDEEAGAHATQWGSPSAATVQYGVVNVASNWSGGTSTFDDYTFQTILHEIAHVLGLGHQGPYNSTSDFEDDTVFELDSWQATMMSYNPQTTNTNVFADYALLQTPMAVDWLALDGLYQEFGYGVSNAFNGNTVYGFNTNISSSVSEAWNQFASYADATASTVIDAGGIDTLDFSGYGADQIIDLTVQTAQQTYQNTSNIGGLVGNLTLGVGTVIENAVGGAGDDLFIGNGANNVFTGGGGHDVFRESAGDDEYVGGAGIDWVEYALDVTNYVISYTADAFSILGNGLDTVWDDVEHFLFDDLSFAWSELETYVDDLGNTDSGPPGSTYVLLDDGLTRAQALAEAQAMGGTLLRIDSQEENDYIFNTFYDGNAIRLDASDEATEGVWLNSDGSAVTYTNWLPNEPNNYANRQHWAYMSGPDGAWGDNNKNGSGAYDGNNWKPSVVKSIVEIPGTAADPVDPVDPGGPVDPVDPPEPSDPPPAPTTGSTYVEVADGLTRAQALAEAQSLGGTLLRIDSQEENDYIFNTFYDGNAIRLDASDVANEGVWVNSDGLELTYTNWLPGQPNNYANKQHWAYMSGPDGVWGDNNQNGSGVHNGNKWVPSVVKTIIEIPGAPSDPVDPPDPIDPVDPAGDEFIFNGSLYERVADGLTRANALAEANALGGTLLRIETAAENEFIFNTFYDGNAIRLDASDEANEGVWKHSDGSTVSYTNWLPNEPNNFGNRQDWAYMSGPDGAWGDNNKNGSGTYDGNRWSPSEVVTIIEIDIA